MRIRHDRHSHAVGVIGLEQPGQMALLISNSHLLFSKAQYVDVWIYVKA